MALVLPIVCKSGEYQQLQAADSFSPSVIQMSAQRILGRITSGVGIVEELTAANARAILILATTDLPTFAGLNTTATITSTVASGGYAYLAAITGTASTLAAGYFQASLSNGNGVYMAFGRAWSADNAGYVNFTPSATPAQNRLSFGFYNHDNLFNVIQSGGVTVGTTSDPGIGNIGLVSVPSTALGSSFAGLLIGNSNIYADNTIAASLSLRLSQNVIHNGAGLKYISTDVASSYLQNGGTHTFQCFVSGSAGGSATPTNKFSIDVNRTSAFIPMLLKNYTVATLPTGGAGDTAFVTDATATTFASIVAGSGANKVPVYSDGTNWRIG